MLVLPKLKLLVAPLMLLVLVGVAGFHYIEHWSWFDGFYMVLTTITSIGYGEIHLSRMSVGSLTLSLSWPALAWCCCSWGEPHGLC